MVLSEQLIDGIAFLARQIFDLERQDANDEYDAKYPTHGAAIAIQLLGTRLCFASLNDLRLHNSNNS